MGNPQQAESVALRRTDSSKQRRGVGRALLCGVLIWSSLPAPLVQKLSASRMITYFQDVVHLSIRNGLPSWPFAAPFGRSFGRLCHQRAHLFIRQSFTNQASKSPYLQEAASLAQD